MKRIAFAMAFLTTIGLAGSPVVQAAEMLDDEPDALPGQALASGEVCLLWIPEPVGGWVCVSENPQLPEPCKQVDCNPDPPQPCEQVDCNPELPDPEPPGPCDPGFTMPKLSICD